MEYQKKAFTTGTILLVLFGMASPFFGFQTVLSQSDRFDDTQSDTQSVDLLDRKGKPATWYLGKGLVPGDQFTYKVCDAILIIPESPDHCYQISLGFIDILKSPHGDVWVIQAVMDHQDKKTYSIFQTSATTFDITTDGTSIPYADSVSRTLFWIGKFANELDQKPLAIGKSWGKIATYTAPETELVVRDTQVMSFDSNEEPFHTFVLGYNLIEQSTVNINEDFPFPIKAVIYKPTISHQNIPLQFTIELVDHTNAYYFADGFASQEIISDQNEESLSDFEDDVLLNETVDENSDTNHPNNSESNMTQILEENQDSSGANFLDAINLEELFEMFLREHFSDDSDSQIINYTVFLDFLNETDSTMIGGQNSTETQP